jgi:2-polyprenyl-6-hydroxyphenyl methylase/3-demethylubiquinone-9 3-methyltransferase
MNRYYAEKLSAERLKLCYDLAPPRVRRYLAAEIEHVLSRISRVDRVLELGCGYGRILPALTAKAGRVVGIDHSLSSLVYGRRVEALPSVILLAGMDAIRLGFREGTFDAVVCIQNGISAFHVDPRGLVRESLRVVRPGGILLFSSYSEKFWPERLDWFRRQAAAGLVGEIDEVRTGGGVIVCKDGFTATTFGPEDFLSLAREFPVEAKVIEVDDSSLFCEMTRR